MATEVWMTRVKRPYEVEERPMYEGHREEEPRRATRGQVAAVTASNKRPCTVAARKATASAPAKSTVDKLGKKIGKTSPKRATTKATKRWATDNVTHNSAGPLKDVDLRDLLTHPAAWIELTPEDQREILALFPDNQHISDAGTNHAAPNIASLLSDDNFRHDTAAYSEHLREGMHDQQWVIQAWNAHKLRADGDFNNCEQDDFRRDWLISSFEGVRRSRADTAVPMPSIETPLISTVGMLNSVADAVAVTEAGDIDVEANGAQANASGAELGAEEPNTEDATATSTDAAADESGSSANEAGAISGLQSMVSNEAPTHNNTSAADSELTGAGMPTENKEETAVTSITASAATGKVQEMGAILTNVEEMVPTDEMAVDHMTADNAQEPADIMLTALMSTDTSAIGTAPSPITIGPAKLAAEHKHISETTMVPPEAGSAGSLSGDVLSDKPE